MASFTNEQFVFHAASQLTNIYIEDLTPREWNLANHLEKMGKLKKVVGKIGGRTVFVRAD